MINCGRPKWKTEVRAKRKTDSDLEGEEIKISDRQKKDFDNLDTSGKHGYRPIATSSEEELIQGRHRR